MEQVRRRNGGVDEATAIRLATADPRTMRIPLSLAAGETRSPEEIRQKVERALRHLVPVA